MINAIEINNFKSLNKLKINSPQKFQVFAGSNASGKSNIFEALEFIYLLHKSKYPSDAISLYQGREYLQNKNMKSDEFRAEISINDIPVSITFNYKKLEDNLVFESSSEAEFYKKNKTLESSVEYKQFYKNFSRIFIGESQLVKRPIKDDSKLSLDGGNLEKVLKRVLKNPEKRELLIEYLTLLIPEFEDILVKEKYISDYELLVKEKFTETPFSKAQISDGTIKIISILTVLLQSNEPQFICIEEPENGLNPKVVQEFVEIFRSFCEDYGHFIWLNTHSQSLVSSLNPEELILVDKKKGHTEIFSVSSENSTNLSLDDAWLTNHLGHGIPW